MRVLVCGSRTFDDGGVVASVLYGLVAKHGPITVIEGGAPGADTHAGAWAELRGAQHEHYPADWDRHGKAAGPIRNQQMLDEGKPDVVWAFVDKPLVDSRGTHDMVQRAKRAGLPTYVVEATP